jgi:hypothetical protein
MSLATVETFFIHIPMDWIVLAAFAILVAFDALRGGLSRPTALAIALPLTLVLIGYMPDATLMGGFAQNLSALLRLLLDAAILIIMFILMYRITDTFGSDSYHILQTLMSGFAVAIVAVVVWLQLPALDSVWHFGPQVQTVFGSAYRFWWLVGAYIALAATRG